MSRKRLYSSALVFKAHRLLASPNSRRMGLLGPVSRVEVPRGEKMLSLCSGTDPESYITEYTLVYEEIKEKKKTPALPDGTPSMLSHQFLRILVFLVIYDSG